MRHATPSPVDVVKGETSLPQICIPSTDQPGSFQFEGRTFPFELPFSFPYEFSSSETMHSQGF